MFQFKSILILLSTTILSLGCSCGSSTEVDNGDNQEPRIPAPVWRSPATPTSTEDPTPSPLPSPTDIPNVPACDDDKVWLCHVPNPGKDCNDQSCPDQENNDQESGTQGIWLCLPGSAVENHLEHHYRDYVRGIEVDVPYCNEEEQ